MKPIALAVLVAVMASGLMAGCATTSPSPTAAMTAYQANQGSLGLKAQDDPEYMLGNPFRALAFVLYPAGLLLQRVTEVPYAYAMSINPSLWGITETEQQYLQQRWGMGPGPNPDAAPGQPATK